MKTLSRLVSFSPLVVAAGVAVAATILVIRQAQHTKDLANEVQRLVTKVQRLEESLSVLSGGLDTNGRPAVNAFCISEKRSDFELVISNRSVAETPVDVRLTNPQSRQSNIYHFVVAPNTGRAVGDDDFKGWSLSIGDVVEVLGTNIPTKSFRVL